jgi:chemotaxis protein MotB
MKHPLIFPALVALIFTAFLPACVSNKQHAAMQAELRSQLEVANKQLRDCGKDLNKCMNDLTACNQDRDKLQTIIRLREEQINDLKSQLDRQVSQVGNLTVLSQSANDNIRETLSQLQAKDKYIQLLQAAKTQADSINLALSVNLKSVLKDGIEDSDVEVKVDKTVVFINLSDKMLFQSGSSELTPRAKEVLGKIAQIVESRPEVEVMVEGYTDNVPIRNNCISDNWDLSVKRSTSVVRVLQTDYKIDPNRLIAAGRGEYNALASNATAQGRSTNRRTRIIILPKLDQFYDLLNPNNVPK